MRLIAALLSILTVGLGPVVTSGEPDRYPPPTWLGETNLFGRHLVRSMGLLQCSTAQRPHTVRILFYGQSITQQRWWEIVAQDLRQRFPHANLVIENRAIGGFASQLLVKTAETDLDPFYPDLLIFHVYGSHVEYEKIIRRVRERTTADILIQTDHITMPAELEEESDPAKVVPDHWNAWMNHAFLPPTARKYDAELCDQRTAWKRYLQDFNLPPSRLLRDEVHLNAHGEYLMAELVKPHLVWNPPPQVISANPPFDPFNYGGVRTYRVGHELHWRDGRLTLAFHGNRIDAVVGPGTAPPAEVRIDGRAPSAFPELTVNTRTSAWPRSNWPCLLRVGWEQPRVIEQWTLTLTEVAAGQDHFRFQVAGSQTGPDGEGQDDQRFVSRSGRVVIEPEDWNFAYARRVFGGDLTAGFKVTWNVLPQYVDALVSSGIESPGRETTVTLAQGLPVTDHRLEISGDTNTPLAAIRVYCPPGAP